MGDAVDVLLPTCDRPLALAVTLTTLAHQTLSLRIVISDQSACAGLYELPALRGVLRYLRHRGHCVETLRHWPRRGLAEHRAFLLAQARAPFVLFIDDDVIIEPDLVGRLREVLLREQCGFVGSALHGLSHVDDVRPEQQAIRFWTTRVRPERVRPGTAAWQRHHLHSAANLLHVQRALASGHPHPLLYRVAWVGGCVMYDTRKLRDSGGFDFWRALPPEHCGEDVLAQLRVMARHGGCGLLPSGAFHLELPTTVVERRVNAPLCPGLLDDGCRSA